MPRAFPNRWGHVFRKGQWVDVARGRVGMEECYRFVRLGPWADYSRAYGREAIVLDEFDDHMYMFLYDELVPSRRAPLCGQREI